MKFSIVVLLVLIFESSAECPPGMKVYGTKCYAYLGTDFPRNTALEICQQTFGPYVRLATPITLAENNFVTKQAQEYPTMYTWLSFIANGQYYIGSNGKTPYFTKWAIGEPFSTATGYCATIGLNGYWYAQPCADSHSGLCESDLDTLTTTTLKPTTKANGYPNCVLNYLHYIPCPTGWEYYPVTCSCFKIINSTTYYNAMNTCRSLGGTLASIHTSGEAAFVERLGFEMKNNDDWSTTASSRDNIIIGLTYNQQQGRLQWDDETSWDYSEGLAPSSGFQQSYQGQIVLSEPLGYATYIQFYDCSFQTCRFAACKRYVQ